MLERELTTEEIRVKNKYFKMCTGFGVAPVSDWINVLVEKDKTESDTKMSEERRFATKLYRQKCADLGVEPKDGKTLKKTKVSKIWSWIIKITDEAVDKRFKEIFRNMDAELVIRRKRKETIRTLYDEGIYVTPEQAQGILKAITNEQITREYKKLGGKENLLVLKEIEMTAYLSEEIEDEDDDDDENEGE